MSGFTRAARREGIQQAKNVTLARNNGTEVSGENMDQSANFENRKSPNHPITQSPAGPLPFDFLPHTINELPSGQGSAPQVFCSRRERR